MFAWYEPYPKKQLEKTTCVRMPVTRKRSRELESISGVLALAKFVSQVQQGQTYAALDGDGHSIYPTSYFKGKVPDSYMPMIEEMATNHSCYIRNESAVIHGIEALGFHNWIGNMIRQVDAKFTWSQKIGRGFQAREILCSVKDWLEANQ